MAYYLYTAGPLCPTVAAYSNTLHSIDSTTSCWTVNYTCDSGYSFSDGSTSNSLTCKGGINIANGTWVGAIPSCEGELQSHFWGLLSIYNFQKYIQ